MTNQTPLLSLVPPSDREFWLERRRALLVELGAIERALGLSRSVLPKAERERAHYLGRRASEEERYGHE